LPSPAIVIGGINVINTRIGYGQYARRRNAEIRERKCPKAGLQQRERKAESKVRRRAATKAKKKKRAAWAAYRQREAGAPYVYGDFAREIERGALFMGGSWSPKQGRGPVAIKARHARRIRGKKAL
jgi:hypothetical protein